MSERLSENAFEKGMESVSRGDYMEALAYFEASIDLTQGSRGLPPMRYLSYYGLCLAMASNRLKEAREICERAVEAEFYNPELYLNLGRVYLEYGDRQRAFSTFVRGLQLNRRHMGLIKQIRGLGFRRRPVLGFLSRQNPVNRLLGLLRSGARNTTDAGASSHAA